MGGTVKARSPRIVPWQWRANSYPTAKPNPLVMDRTRRNEQVQPVIVMDPAYTPRPYGATKQASNAPYWTENPSSPR